jgi:hypothetical protein
MRKIIGLFVVALSLVAFQANAQKARPLKSVMTLEILGEGGSNGASVVWHPIQKKYYASMAGNASFPMGVYSEKGKLLSDEDLAAQFDLRGLWFNPITKTINGNGYGEGGWVSYKLNAKGIPTDIKMLFEGMYQPSEQSVATYDGKTNSVYFLEGNEVVIYNGKTGEQVNGINIFPGLKKAPADGEEVSGEIGEDYNTTVVVFTGIPRAEFGLLNVTNKEIELYNKATGYLTQKLKLPEEAELSSSFCFAYTNGIYFLFDKEARKWIGYK